MATRSDSSAGRDVPDGARVTMARLEDQISYFDRKSRHHQRSYKWLKAAVFIASALITASCAIALQDWIVAILGGLIFVVESLLGLSSHHQNWLSFRTTCEALEREKHLFLAGAGPYRRAAKDSRGRESALLLAERIETLLGDQHSAWVTTRREHAEQAEAEGERT